MNPDKRCDKFDRTNSSQSQTCLSGEACLMYTWRKSGTETATLRECFPTRVLLGSIRNPLRSAGYCEVRDITDDGSGSIRACLCDTDYCNDDNIAAGDAAFGLLENEIFDTDRDVKAVEASTFPSRITTTTTRRTTTRRPVTQRPTTTTGLSIILSQNVKPQKLSLF